MAAASLRFAPLKNHHSAGVAALTVAPPQSYRHRAIAEDNRLVGAVATRTSFGE